MPTAITEKSSVENWNIRQLWAWKLKKNVPRVMLYKYQLEDNIVASSNFHLFFIHFSFFFRTIRMENSDEKWDTLDTSHFNNIVSINRKKPNVLLEISAGKIVQKHEVMNICTLFPTTTAMHARHTHLQTSQRIFKTNPKNEQSTYTRRVNRFRRQPFDAFKCALKMLNFHWIIFILNNEHSGCMNIRCALFPKKQTKLLSSWAIVNWHRNRKTI